MVEQLLSSISGHIYELSSIKQLNQFHHEKKLYTILFDVEFANLEFGNANCLCHKNIYYFKILLTRKVIIIYLKKKKTVLLYFRN